MRKKIILTVMAFVAITVAILGTHYLKDNETKGGFTPEVLTVNMLEKKAVALWDEKKNADDKVSKFLVRDMEGACVYSLNQKYFFLVGNTKENKNIIYLECATEQNCKPVALTASGNYMIVENEQKQQLAVKLVEGGTATKQASEVMAFNDLIQEEKDSLFELIEA